MRQLFPGFLCEIVVMSKLRAWSSLCNASRPKKSNISRLTGDCYTAWALSNFLQGRRLGPKPGRRPRPLVSEWLWSRSRFQTASSTDLLSERKAIIPARSVGTDRR